MKKIMRANIHVSPKELYDYFANNAKIEKEKIDSQKKVMDEKLKEVTKGKNIIISNFNCSNTAELIRR